MDSLFIHGTRFDPKFVSLNVAARAMELFKGPHLLKDSQIIHSVVCYVDGSQLRVVKTEHPKAPRCAADFWMLNYLRCYTDCIMTTGAILRLEQSCFDKNLPQILGFDPQVYFQKPKPLCVMTNRLENLMESNPVYKEPCYSKLVLTSPKSYIEGSDGIEIKAVPDLNLCSALSFVQQAKGYEKILIESGPQTVVPAYLEHNDSDCPIDTIYLSMF